MKKLDPAVVTATLGLAFFILPKLSEAVTTGIRADYSSCGRITCVPSSGAAHIIVSRASTETAGTGILGTVADAIVTACPGSDVAANPYPALLKPYMESEAQGLGNLTEMVTTYNACCPKSSMVLLGYSQGAQVTADFLCGTSSLGFTPTTPYAEAVAFALDAIVLMGDPSFVKGLPWDRGNASNVSYFPRVDNQACNPLADKLISYCDSGDLFCDNGTDAHALDIHEGYVLEYGTRAVEFTVSKIKGCSAKTF